MDEEGNAKTQGCQTSPGRHEEEEQATSTLRTDRGAMRQRRATQASHQREPQRLQHRINFHYPGHELCETGHCRLPANRRPSACSTESASLSKIWTLWGAAAVEKPPMGFEPTDEHLNLHVPEAPFPDIMSPAPVERRCVQFSLQAWSDQHGCEARTHTWCQQSESTGSFHSVSAERRAKPRRAKPMAFSTAPPATPQCHRKNKRDRERRRLQRRRRRGRSACIETLEDAFWKDSSAKDFHEFNVF